MTDEQIQACSVHIIKPLEVAERIARRRVSAALTIDREGAR
jgi:hypothetical protein